MRRTILAVIGTSWLAVAAGCAMCDTPYDYTSPVVDSYDSHYHDEQVAPYAPAPVSAPAAQPEPYYAPRARNDDPATEQRDISGMKSVVRRPASNARRATPESDR